MELRLEGEVTHRIYQREFRSGTTDRTKPQVSMTTIWQGTRERMGEYIRGKTTGVGHEQSGRQSG